MFNKFIALIISNNNANAHRENIRCFEVMRGRSFAPTTRTRVYCTYTCLVSIGWEATECAPLYIE